MGCMTSKSTAPSNNNGDGIQRVSDPRNEVRLLLLGPGESGKSTVLQQLKAIHNHGLSREDRKRLDLAVHSHIMACMRAIVMAMATLYIPLENPELRPYLDHVASLPRGAAWSDETRIAIQRLWCDAGVRACFDRSNEYQINDNADYFFDRLDAISAPDYVPTEDDALRLRIQTSGIFETKFSVGPMIFHVVDVGGQRSERRKWLLCFTDVTAILFVVAISSYDQTLREDETTNRLREALELFESIWRNKYLQRVSVILLQNKIDQFAAKIKRSDLSVYFPDYTGGSSYGEATKYIQNRFLRLATPLDHKQLYTHFICAVDREIVRSVFADIKNIILNNNLRRYGLV